ncbi:MAG: SPOR domain-containing protein [Chitinispirillia bacterium]|jgi:hypothetical protein
MVLKNLFLAGLLMSIILSGCNKDKNKDTFDELSIENSEIEPVATDNESDAIFDEFYEESKPEKQEEISPPEKTEKTRMRSQPQFFPNGRYVVQVTCVQSKNFARKIAIKLEDRGYPAYIAEVENPTPDLTGLYHRVRIGGFPSYSSAKAFGEDFLVSDGYKYWVDNRSNDNIGFSGFGPGSKSAGNEYEVSGTSKQQYSTPESETPVSSSRTETEIFEQKQSAASISATAPENPEVPEQSSQVKPQEEWDEIVAEQVPQSTPAEDETPAEPTEALVEPTPAHNTASESSESFESSEEEEEEKEEDDDWGELDEEWGSDTSDW